MTDTMETVNCPACGKVMQKYFIQSGCAIDICTDGCGGMFFDNQEIQELNKLESDVEEIKKILQNKNFNIVDENLTRICPACGTKMIKTRALGVQIDTCYKCNGIFLDKGELELVRSHFKKRKKVQPLDLNTENDINLKDFYYDAAYENFKKQYHLEEKKRPTILDIVLSFMI
jgi:Zn-finger nucleic acid-binding protein